MSNYKISVNLGGDIYEGEGNSALEALQALPQPVKIFNKAIVTWTKDEENRIMMLMPSRVKRLWWKLAQPVLAKGFEQGLIGLK